MGPLSQREEQERLPRPWSFWREHDSTDTPNLGPEPSDSERVDPCPCKAPHPVVFVPIAAGSQS